MSIHRLAITTTAKREIIDVTQKITALLKEGAEGLATVFVEHTTAAITTADLDPGTDQDLLNALDGLLPELNWQHQHDPTHAPDHLLSSIVGTDVSVPFQDGQLRLGTWQRIILIEFDGPRDRNVSVVLN
jgi:secondary thiamine-phosphate synthase enzyme